MEPSGQKTAEGDPQLVTDVEHEGFQGAVSPAWRSDLMAALESRGQALIVFLSAGDIRSCEDLGRQLRELRRVLPEREWPMIVATEAPDTGTVASWVRRERLGVEAVLVLPPERRLVGGRTVRGVAAALVNGQGVVLRGVSHPRPTSNVRTRSFAEELGLARSEPDPPTRAGEAGNARGPTP